MENASKALLIAGAILIVILLIGVGMLVYQGAMGGIDEGIQKMTAQEQQMFNSTFTNYEGTRVSGSRVRALIQDIISSNNANKEINGKLVSIGGDTTIDVTAQDLKSSALSDLRISINTGAYYTVKAPTGDNGLVNKVTITKN